MYKDCHKKAFFKLFGVNGYYFPIVRDLENSDDIDNINILLAQFEYFCTL